MKYVFIADFFVDEILGGGEINNEELAGLLRQRGHSVIEIKSSDVTSDFITDKWNYRFVVSNFVNLLDDAKEALKQVRYIIYEHDHKYLKRRNPALFENYLAPPDELVNLDFYRQAAAVLCQTGFHADIVKANTKLENIINVGGNLWSPDSFKVMEECLKKEKKVGYSILNSPISHKGTLSAIRFCELKGLPYELVSSNDHYEFLNRLSNNQNFVFFPRTPETLSRVVCEARMMGMKVLTNNLVGATKEEWFSLEGQDLIEYMKEKREDVAETVMGVFSA